MFKSRFVWMVGASVMGCSSTSMEDSAVHTDLILSESTPGYTAEPPNTTALSEVLTVRYLPSVDPIPLKASFGIDLVVEATADGSMVEGAQIVVDADMPIHKQEMTVIPETEEVGGGIYRASPLRFHTEGWWIIGVDITVDDATETFLFNVDCCQ